jgi:sodium/proline symporter
MVAGAMTVILWTQSAYLKNLLYEMIPGFAASLAAIVIVSLLTKAPEGKIAEQFDRFKASL